MHSATHTVAAPPQPDFRALFEASPGLFLVLLPDAPHFTIVAVSNAYIQATMTQRETMIGKGLFEVFPDDPDDPKADGVLNLRASLERTLASLVPDAMAVQKYNVRRPESEGGDFEERWWSPLNTPVLDAQGQVSYLIHRVEDVTEFVRLKQTDAEHEKHAAALRERAQQMELDVFQRGRQLQEANEKLRQANAEAERLYAKTRELDQLKTQFFATVSHELRTPLTLILGPVQALQARTDLDAATQHQLAVVGRNARTLLHHVNDLLEVARLEAGHTSLAYVRTDAARLARFVASHFESLAQSRQITYTVDVPNALDIEADAVKLQRVLLNLLSNAFKFTPDGGRVRLSLTSRSGQLVLDVADSGPGIPADQRGVVFEAFRRMERDTQRHVDGTGLGLAIVRDFVVLHGGDVQIDEAPEGGALVTVTMPLKAPINAPVGSPENEAADINNVQLTLHAMEQQGEPTRLAAEPGQGPLILVVEDNPDMCRYVCESLCREGYRLMSACNGEEGLSKTMTHRPELILTDVMMPIMSGDDMIARLREQADFDDTPVVVLSAKADDALRTRMLRDGAQDFLVKPFLAEELLARVGNLIKARLTTRALRRSEEQLRELFQQAFDGIFIAGPDGRFNEINDAGCALMGEPREALTGKTSFELIAPDQHARMKAVRATLMSGKGEVHVAEWLIRRKDGRTLPVEVKARLMSDGRWVSFVRDISAHKSELAISEGLAEQLEWHVQQRTDQLRRLGADLEAVEERERRKIAQDLHDDLGQILAAARIWLASLCASPHQDVSKPAREVDALIERANRSTRSLAAQLAPAMLYELGLCPALEWLSQDIARTFDLKVSYLDDGQPKPLSQNASSILYRAARELLINAAKHARSESAMIQTLREGERIIVKVTDAGVGFDPAQLTASTQRGMGLVSVRERLSFIGGTAEIRSIPGDGTEAVLSALLDGQTSPTAAKGDTPLASVDQSLPKATHADDALQDLIDALAGRVAVFDPQGRIRCVNRAWCDFARASGDHGCHASGPGTNYLDICRESAADNPYAEKALHGLLAVLNGQQPAFAQIYPCHTPDAQHWFMMHAAPLVDGSCLVSHIELSDWVDPDRMTTLQATR